MKTLPYIIATTFLLFSTSLQAQVFQGELEPVYLENTEVSLNDFESVNDEINNSEILFIVHHLPGTSSAVPLIEKSIDRQSVDCLFLCLSLKQYQLHNHENYAVL